MLRKNYCLLDIAKLFFAVVVVAIHTNLFLQPDGTVNKYFTTIFAEAAVPFFFIASGMFLGIKHEAASNKVNLWAVTQRYGLLALVWGGWYSLLSIAVDLFSVRFVNCGEIIRSQLLKSVLGSPGGGTWYLVSLFFCVLVIAVLNKYIDLKKSERQLLIICGGLYLIPYIWWIDNSFLESLRSTYFNIFSSKTLFVFFIIYVMIGFYYGIHQSKIKNNSKVIILMIGILCVSKLLIYDHIQTNAFLMIIYGLLSIAYNISVFCILVEFEPKNINTVRSKKCRSYSTIIYLSHYTVICGIKLLIQIMKIDFMYPEAMVFALVLLICFMVCLIVERNSLLRKLFFLS